MTRVIPDQDERTIARQMFRADDLEPIVDSERDANDERNERAQRVDEHVGLARKLAQSLDRRFAEIAHRRIAPTLHSCR